MDKIHYYFSHWAINDEFERTAPTLVFLLMLGCRLVVDWQMERKEKAEATTAMPAKTAASTPTAAIPAAAAAAAAVTVSNKRKKEE